MGRGEQQQYGHQSGLRVLTLAQERILEVPNRGFFITTANGKAYKAQLAEKIGYRLLSHNLSYMAEEAGQREDIFSEKLGIKTADFLYGEGKVGARTVSNTVQAAVNKAEGVKWCYEELVQSNSSQVGELEGKKWEVMDNQMVIVYPSGKKVAFKKPRKDPRYQYGDIQRLISVMQEASAMGAHVEYHSAFVSGAFGSQEEEIKTVRTIMGEVRPIIDTELMARLMLDNSHITGGMDIIDLTEHFIDHEHAKILVRTYTETSRHYLKMVDDGVEIDIHDTSTPQNKNHIVIVDGLQQRSERAYQLGKDHTRSNPDILSALARGFIELTI